VLLCGLGQLNYNQIAIQLLKMQFHSKSKRGPSSGGGWPELLCITPPLQQLKKKVHLIKIINKYFVGLKIMTYRLTQQLLSSVHFHRTSLVEIII